MGKESSSTSVEAVLLFALLQRLDRLVEISALNAAHLPRGDHPAAITFSFSKSRGVKMSGKSRRRARQHFIATYVPVGVTQAEVDALRAEFKARVAEVVKKHEGFRGCYLKRGVAPQTGGSGRSDGGKDD